MDKKKNTPPEDMRGFEEFIDSVQDKSFLGRPQGGPKRESVEHITFLTNDSERLNRIKNLLSEKLPFSARHEQAQRLLEEQAKEIADMRARLFTIADKKDSPLRKSLSQIFDSFFKSPG